MQLRTTCLFALFFFNSAAFAQDTLRIMAYNLLNYSGSGGVITRYVDMETIIDYTLPDIVIANEVVDVTGVSLLLANSFNTNGRSHYQAATFVDGPDSDNMLFYNSDKVTLESQTQISTALRDISHYRMYYANGTDTSWINLLSAHLKASSGSAEETQRLNEVMAMCSYLATVDPDEIYIFGGDFNFYTSAESGWNYATSNNCAIRFYDPINQVGAWHANSAYAAIHTQSTRSSTSPGCCGGSTGGLDDRFDFLLANDELINETHFMKIIPGSYKAFGNDANHYNVSLLEGAANGVVPSTVNQALFNMSDHLPVMMDVLVQWDLRVEEQDSKLFRFHFTGDVNGAPSFSLNSEAAGEYAFEITDASGKIVEQKREVYSRGAHQFSLGNQLAPGIYFVRIMSGDEFQIVKFVR